MSTTDLDRALVTWFDAVEPRSEPPGLLDDVFATTRTTGQDRGPSFARVIGSVRSTQAWPRGAVSAAMLAIVLIVAAAVVAVGLRLQTDIAAPSSRPSPEASASSVVRTLDPATFTVNLGDVPGLDGRPWELLQPFFEASSADEENMWITASSDLATTSARVESETGVVHWIDAENPGPIAPQQVWSADGRWLVHRDRADGSIIETIPIDFDALAVSVGEEGLWVNEIGAVDLVDPATGHVLRSIESHAVPGTPYRSSMRAPSFGSLWEFDRGEGRKAVIRIDPVSGETVATIPIPPPDSCLTPVPIDPSVSPGALRCGRFVIDAGTDTIKYAIGVDGAIFDHVTWRGVLYCLEQSTVDTASAEWRLLQVDAATGQVLDAVVFRGDLPLYDIDISDRTLWLMAGDPVLPGMPDVANRLLRIPIDRLVEASP
jgi:hypothetical protein